jgi:hypothetical protein
MYPSSTHSHLVERLSAAPVGSRPRRWILRDDNHQHYHGVVRLAENLLLLELRWKPQAKGSEQLVGVYRLNLKNLLAENYIRSENTEEVRVRFFRGSAGTVYLQVRSTAPELPIGRVKL